MLYQRILDKSSISDTHTIFSNNVKDYAYKNGNTNIDVSNTSAGIIDKNNNNTDNNNRNQSSNKDENFNNKMQRRSEQSVGAVQLTPLWEHVLRTRRLPEAISPSSIFAEFHERLQDPEWQVRQHALRVLVDVLVVMQAKADKHNVNFLLDLIRNLGHQAPTVRKGALDCLRVYLSETATTKLVMQQILDTGLSQDLSYDERLSCGVLLSLPALLQSILHTPQCHFVIKDILERLMERLHHQQTQQEVTVKVLAKICELLGVQDFENYLDELPGTDNVSLYRHLYQLYGLTTKPTRSDGSNVGAWRAIPRDHSWRNSPQSTILPEKGKVIMETEIKINDDTLTMRILEADTETEETDSPIAERDGDLVCRPLVSSHSPQMDIDAGGIIQIISDSEAEDVEDPSTQNKSLLGTPMRGLKRVTFGGEVVKMRTPDSDAPISANNIESISSTPDQSKFSVLKRVAADTMSLPVDEHTEEGFLTALTLEIPSDNTKPLSQTRSAQSPQRSNSFSSQSSLPSVKTTSCHLSPKKELAQSPAYRIRSHSISPAGSNSVSPKIPHKEIEVLHNLQRDVDPSPRSFRHTDSVDIEEVIASPTSAATAATQAVELLNSWEDLDIVSYKTILDLRSGDWRNRLQGITQLEIALSSSSNLLLVQPYLDSLLRTLLSSERNCNVAELKRELLVNLISRLPLDNLEERTHQILLGLCRQGNAGANRVCKTLMQRLPAGTIVAKLTAPDYLHAKSSKFRDHALQMAIYALMTFPGTCFDINILTAQVTYAALNRKRRVRQAALEVLAVLADISSVEQILQIVSDITAGIESGKALLSAVKMRLSRLQLPIISPDGAVLYEFHKADQSGNLRLGADIDWVAQGDGSASPSAIKRRNHNMLNKKRNTPESLDTENSNTNGIHHGYLIDENLHRHSFHSPPEALDISRPSVNFSQKKSYGTSVIQASFAERRVASQADSEFSMDGRSSDSTTTTCSNGSGSSCFSQLTPCNATINRRLVRQNSRFPIVRQHTDFISNFMRNIHRSPYPYSYEDSKHTKVSNAAQKPLKQQGSTKPSPSQQQVLRNNVSQAQCSILPRITAISMRNGTQNKTTKDFSKLANSSGYSANLLRKIRTLFYKAKDFVLEKAMRVIPYNRCICPFCVCREKPKREKSMQIDKRQETVADKTPCQVPNSPKPVDKNPAENEVFTRLHLDKLETEAKHTTATATITALEPDEADVPNPPGSPLSVKSTSYSQKSTASAKSFSSQNEISKLSGSNPSGRMDNDMNLVQKFGELIVDDIEEETEIPAQESTLKRNESVNSLYSKTESIKTQIEDATPQMSRAQSVKSLAIEEEIESSNSFIVVEEIQHELESTASLGSPIKQISSEELSELRASSSKKSLTSQEDRPHSRSISLDSLLGIRSDSKQGSLDTIVSTTDNSSQVGSQLDPTKLENTPKLQHTPLKQKSKTYFFRGHRRISPVKQAIKMSQSEIFPPSMTRFEKPREALIKTLDQLDATIWEENMTGLKSMVRLIRYHSEVLDSHMHMTCIQLTRSVRNLRSQVARAACQAAVELFTLKCKSLELECDDLVCALLHRTADTNRFIRADATRALESMVDQMHPQKVLNILTTKGAQHQNALVRTTTAKLLFRLVERLGSARVYSMARENRDKFFMVGANLLLEGSLETRSYAKSMFRALSEHASYQRILLEVIPPQTYRNVEKTLRGIAR